MFSRVGLFVTPWTRAHQAPLSMEFSRQEYWSRLSFPPPGDLSDPGSKPVFPVSSSLTGRFFTTEPPGKASSSVSYVDTVGLPRWHKGDGFTCQCRRHRRCRLHPWVGKIPWRRKWQPTPVFLLGKFHGQRSLAGYRSWGCRVRHDVDIVVCIC